MKYTGKLIHVDMDKAQGKRSPAKNLGRTAVSKCILGVLGGADGLFFKEQIL